MKQTIQKYLETPVSIAPLAMFRVLFGLVMFVSVVRFILKGWVKEFYIDPSYYFTYYGFEWVRPLGEVGMYVLYGVLVASTFLVMLGLFYRVASVVFFLSFTYAELIDKTYYLNHYFFISLMAFLMIWLPAHRSFSLDVIRKPSLRVGLVPRRTVGIVRFQLAMVYVFAGLAKLNYAWLFEAMPLKIWLAGRTDLPVLGAVFDWPWIPYVFSWSGAIYDLTIVYFLLNRKTRIWAYGAVIVFHVLTRMLFNIGMFPYIMILSTLIFFSSEFHQTIINTVQGWFKRTAEQVETLNQSYRPARKQLAYGVLSVFFVGQLLLAVRFLAYPGNLFWTEQGYRYSWRVMLAEKAGTAFFSITDGNTGGKIEIENRHYLTETQEKMMSYQPDMILQYAHYLYDLYNGKPIALGNDTLIVQNPKVTADVFVRLNNTGSRRFIDPTVDLAKEREGFHNKSWILHYND